MPEPITGLGGRVQGQLGPSAPVMIFTACGRDFGCGYVEYTPVVGQALVVVS